MCGIAGCFHPGASGPCDQIDGQLATLRHRGPDSVGSTVAPGATVGQARLAVIDLVTGDPPITNESASIHAVLNGEIYNFLALRAELEKGGHLLKTHCDTEVLAHLAEKLQPTDLACRLEGMFAFAIYDQRRRRLVLGRDRLGVKPLFYWHSAGTLVFGSEPKAVLAHAGVPRTMDSFVLPAYLTLGYVPSPRTFFQGICAVPPAHVLVVDEGREPRLERYWSSPLVGDCPGATPPDTPEAARRVRELLDAAVRLRLLSDVPLGAFLSGGIDSSAVVALMSRHSDHPVKTFTIGFEDSDGFDERPYAAMIARRYRTDHTEFVVKPHAADLIEELVAFHDAPFGDSSSLPTYLLSKLTRGEVTVALCGDGGDEMFAGYERFAAALMVERLGKLPRSAGNAAASLASVAARRLHHPLVQRANRMLAQRHTPTELSFLAWMSFVAPAWVTRLLPNGAYPEPATRWAVDNYTSLWNPTEGATTLQRLQQVNIDTYLLDDLLPKVDRMAMAHGLEVRSPFLDRELVEYALCLPDSTKLRGISLKRVLKHAVADLLPHEILHRPKHGFGIPLDRWFRQEMRGYLEAHLCSPKAAVRHHLAPQAVSTLVGEHLAGANHGHALWTLVTLDVFLQKQGW